MQIPFINNLKKAIILPLFLIAQFCFSAQIVSKHFIIWETLVNKSIGGKVYPQFISFKEANINVQAGELLPVFGYKTFLKGTKNIKVILRNVQYENTNVGGKIQQEDLLKSDIIIKQWMGTEKKEPTIAISFIPIRKNNGTVEKITSFEIVIEYDTENLNEQKFSKTGYTSSSVLGVGEWYKIGINQTGIHALNKTYLQSLGINVNGIDPRTIKIYGMGAGMLAQRNNAFRYDDLPENAILIEGESDGKFDDGDRILFYGQGQSSKWNYNQSSKRYSHELNIYSDVTYYFITFGGIQGKRITNLPAGANANTQVTQFDQLYYYENELYNVIKSGRRWLGEEFSRVNTYSFPVNMGNVNTAEVVYFVSNVAARSFSPSSFSVSINQNNVFNQSIPKVEPDYESPFAFDNRQETQLSVAGGNLTVSYTYNIPIPGSIGWLDFFELQSRNFLNQTSPQLLFRDSRSVAQGNTSEFMIPTGSPVSIWDVTNSTNARAITVNFNGSIASFITGTDSLREFVSFTGAEFITPISGVKMGNQNLHSLPQADLFIITHNQFINEANLLAQFHRNNSNLTAHVVTVDAIYHEFSSGAQDLSAIRDFLRMFYKRANTPQEMPKYLTILGRASYDFKNRVANNTNYVPSFQSIASFSPIGSYNSDDYFGFLDDGEGAWDSGNDANELLDIAIGRLPAQNNTQAQNMIQKIINYVQNPDFGDWKTKLVFVADDEDFNTHLNGAETLANKATNDFKNYNVKKIYIDAYQEENTAGGARNPSAQSELVRAVEQGAMVVNYTGHGGEVGWTSERILNTDDINGWRNGKKLPLFVTATCEFSRFDDPSRTSAGEMVLLNPNGGGIALFTTVRLVFSSANDLLNGYFFNRVGLDSIGALNPKRLGEVMRLTKNDYFGTRNDNNSRNFTLLGDPAIFLAYPKHRVQTLSVQNNPVSSIPDTLKAFSKIAVSGRVVDAQNNPLNQFNGVVYTTIYDKKTNYRTIGTNRTSTVQNFTMQNNVIYRGKASVVKGLFTFSFVVPKDISYEIGYGKISYLAENGTQDAIGNYQNIIVGGTSDSIAADGIGPEIKLYLNDEKFVYGGITSENPTLIVKLKDENGINITGRGVGRDIGMTINNDVTKTTALNDYYQAKLDSYQEGEARYKIDDLPQGKNTLTVRAYDVYNNSSDALLEFIVTNSQEVALNHVLNYPNPFTTNTTFHFDHNKAGEPITVQIQIFTISGKIVKNLQTETISNGNHFDQLTWDGKDEFGDNIGKGVYVYKVKLKSTTGKTAEEYQKLVILN